ncbi:MAG: hypothetical protein GY906_07705 [bacterium]|nr:hypothetical protein [bacterium]
MTTRRRLDLWFGSLMLVLATLLLLRIPFGSSNFYSDIIDAKTMLVIGSVIRIISLFVAWFFIRRGARQFEEGNPARTSWRLLEYGLGGFFIAQLVLGGMNTFLADGAPYPSVADAIFVFSTILLVIGIASFNRVYSLVGIVSSNRTQSTLIAAVATIVLLIVNWKALAPIISADAPALETFVNCAYPVLDSVLAIASLVLLRTTLSFLGGHLWRVWLALLAGFLCLAAGDILYAYYSTMKMAALDPIMDVMFTWAYLLMARGAIDHFHLITGKDE